MNRAVLIDEAIDRIMEGEDPQELVEFVLLGRSLDALGSAIKSGATSARKGISKAVGDAGETLAHAGSAAWQTAKEPLKDISAKGGLAYLGMKAAPEFAKGIGSGLGKAVGAGLGAAAIGGLYYGGKGVLGAGKAVGRVFTRGRRKQELSDKELMRQRDLAKARYELEKYQGKVKESVDLVLTGHSPSDVALALLERKQGNKKCMGCGSKSYSGMGCKSCGMMYEETGDVRWWSDPTLKGSQDERSRKARRINYQRIVDRITAKKGPTQ